MNNIIVNLNGYNGQNGTITLFTEIYINLSLFWKNVGIYHFLGTRVSWKNFPTNLKAILKKKKNQVHGTLEHPKSDKSLHIFKTMVD